MTKKRAYYEANRAEIAEKKRAYYEANRAEIAEKKRAYRQADPERHREYVRRYRARKKAAAALHGTRCTRCGIPFTRTAPVVATTVCRDCHEADRGWQG